MTNSILSQVKTPYVGVKAFKALLNAFSSPFLSMFAAGIEYADLGDGEDGRNMYETTEINIEEYFLIVRTAIMSINQERCGYTRSSSFPPIEHENACIDVSITSKKMWSLTWTSRSGTLYYFISDSENGYYLVYPETSSIAEKLAAIGEAYKL